MDREMPPSERRREPAGAGNFGVGGFFAPMPSPPPSHGKVPPHNIEAEMTVLGGILLENRSLDSAYEIGLQPEDFYQESHQRIYRAILDLASRSQPADVVTLRNALMNAGILEKVGGAQYIAELVASEYSAVNVPAYAQIVKEKSVERKIISVCSEQATKAYSGVEDHHMFREETEKKILEATSERKLSSFSSLGETMHELYNHLQEVAARKTQIIGVPSGFIDLDKETMGWHAGQLIIIAARPGMGKTSFMLNTSLKSAIEADTSVAIFSMEMSKRELAMRLVSMEARVDSNRLKNASRLDVEDWRKLQNAGSKLEKARLYLDDTPALNLLELKSRVRRIHTQHGLGLVVVDYLQLMRGIGNRVGSASSREQEIAEISRGLKALAKEMNVPVIAASQLSREVERREKKKPQLSDLRESGAIEQDADIVIFIHRDKDNPELQNEAELIIGKHRSGNTGDIKVGWQGQYTTFTNYQYGGDPHGSSGSGPDIF